MLIVNVADSSGNKSTGSSVGSKNTDGIESSCNQSAVDGSTLLR